MSTAPAVLVTGASSGIGRAAALDLAARGWQVFAGVRRPVDADELRKSAPQTLTPLLFDVTSSAAVAAAAEQVAAAGRPLAGLVNNAGMIVPGPLALLSTDDFRHQLEVNVLGAHTVTRALLPLLLAAGGRIVLMGSFTGRVSPPYMGAYAASKHALEAMADALRVELRGRVRVSIIEPDSVATSIWDKMESGLNRAETEASAELRNAFADDFAAMRQAAAVMRAQAMPVESVVRAIRHALTARRPRARYPVGLRTRLAFWAFARIGAPLRDWFVRRSMGLP